MADDIYLETASLRLVLSHEPEGKLISIYDKEKKYEWLIQRDDSIKRSPTENDDFHQFCMYGWEEMFPTLLSCRYPNEGKYYNKILHDHGELWFGEWDVKSTGDKIIQSFPCKTYDMIFTREISFSGPRRIDITYNIKNVDSEELYFFWAAHPFFRVKNGDSIIFPDTVRKIINVFEDDEFGEEGSILAWSGKEIDGTSLKKKKKYSGCPDREGPKLFLLMI